ncbi:C40 family peptidase [Gellertiella hungarica]|uniref:Cell wall-associated NlpC family hydrolase n=1 Tax=Gellertiella hungarica TaxID=1572859 RepID=A0A7W6J7X5_9HYPH|nr:NlpC/P60 family protein [Gellertiella hungarica]MBB4066450.1 cell wall-associated NlpC family hydrolase [Gellertiella hungarica]
MSRMPDRRTHAYRPDLASAALKGVVEAERFVEGLPAHVTVPVADLRPEPDMAAGIDTQLLRGEEVAVFERRNGWAFVQARLDHYVGYLPENQIAEGEAAATHIVVVPRSFSYPGPELKRPPLSVLSLGSRLKVAGEAETRGTRYLLLETGEAVIAAHCLPLGSWASPDPVSIALRFLETPYLWGGRSGFGIDCSGLVQLAHQMTGRLAPRDSDMQRDGYGDPVAIETLERGDLVFWKGHVGIMEDPETLLHASGHTMSVTREGFREAVERIGYLYGPPTLCRRPV